MSLRHPIARARGLGSAKSGSHHFIVQRLTAVALIPLAVWFLLAVLGLLRGEYADARTFVAQPLNASLMSVFVIALFYHAQLGVQVVIEDYVHTPWAELTLQIGTKFACFFAAVASLLAIVRIALGS